MTTQTQTQAEPKNTPTTDIMVPIEGMTCASCVGRVEKALAKVEEVESVVVNLATERVDVTMRSSADRQALVKTIEATGYSVPAMSS